MRHTLRSGGMRGSGMGNAGRGAESLVSLNVVSISRVDMTDMGVGCDRRELNDDQKDRRPNHPQKCSGPGHVQLLLYDPVQVNNG